MRRHEELGHPVPGRRRNQQLVGDVCVLNRGLDAGQPVAVASPDRFDRTGPGEPVVILLRHGPGRRLLAGCDLRQMLLGQLLRAAAGQGVGHDVRWQHRPGEEGATEELGDDTQVTDALTGDRSAAELLGYEHGGPAELGAFVPGVRVRTRSGRRSAGVPRPWSNSRRETCPWFR